MQFLIFLQNRSFFWELISFLIRTSSSCVSTVSYQTPSTWWFCEESKLFQTSLLIFHHQYLLLFDYPLLNTDIFYLSFLAFCSLFNKLFHLSSRALFPQICAFIIFSCKSESYFLSSFTLALIHSSYWK